MLRRIGWLIGWNNRVEQVKKLPDAKPLPAQVQPAVMLDTVQEIAVYIHRFHNLDLFQQGWYRLKITMRWENELYTSMGAPSRVMQYEAPNVSSDDVYGVWRIDDSDNSFSTRPFRIKYAKQDVLLSILVAFSLPLTVNEGPFSSAVILKFELLYSPVMEKGSEFQASSDGNPAAVHEFRIPPKALLGLHSYCPVYFDSFHAVLVDVSVHTCLLKVGSHKGAKKIPRVSYSAPGAIAGGTIYGSSQALERMASIDLKHTTLVKALLDARDTLLAELKRIGDDINKGIDLTDFTSTMDDTKLSGSILHANLGHAEVSGQGKPQNGLEGVNSNLDVQLLQNLSKDDIIKMFNLWGEQVSYLWSTFLNFHRDNRTQILQFLFDAWAKDRRAEWSIWMVYTNVEMPHHSINGGFDEPSHHLVHKRGPSLLKLTDDPAELATMRAELHRRSIGQMRINNRSIQDMQLFGDPSGVPIVIMERVITTPRRSISDNSYLRNLDVMNLATTSTFPEAGKNQSSTSAGESGHDLKIVVFVHGFQGHHLDLRLVRNQWLLIDSKIHFLMSEANEEKTSGDFRDMGLRLAHEVIAYVKKKMDKASRNGNLRDIRLSFVGHSIGNIIIRTALAETIMEPYLRFLHTYVSVSGPHLGYLYSSNSLFNSGLWLLKKLKGSQCIHQLTFTDDPDIRNTFFFKLSKQKTLDSFKNIILLSSPQDGYVPYHSARIESCRAASSDYSRKGKAFLEMLNECLDQIRAPTSENRVFIRCDVNFDTSMYGKNLNTFIGRAAHIEFLESDIFARFIMWSFPELFQ
ncbi:protein FAM135B-like isoform X1 [Hibiscus syriacus]|uniref:protein FAM135B-like isoform X1 n=1 Tax=Hibiscus syriacus TaxID=106335 RepID=UPI001924E6F3|nr:protein FAM135B-like isoform X1 [Hibiscus syriacus]XP_039023569.1 protein FAM135B-like isoform X1 [Hibiscus syriacus]